MNLKSENVSTVSSVHIKPEEFKNAVHFGESHDHCDAVVFKMFSVHMKTKFGVFKYLRGKILLVKLRLRDGLVSQ